MKNNSKKQDPFDPEKVLRDFLDSPCCDEDRNADRYARSKTRGVRK